ncbi:MAG: hypothetical protein GX643_08720 [Acidimicrobiales bacterium]|nr:hypothetical protein [Acidimicrobiales bacterium]
MITACWSLKGGSGTTVVSAGLALSHQRRFGERALLVDLAGDLPLVLGMPEPSGPGVTEWLAAGSSAPPDALARLEQRVGPGLTLLHRGEGDLSAASADLLLQVLTASGRTVVVDCGVVVPGWSVSVARQVAAEANRSLLVTRPCYLALRRADVLPITPSGVVVVRESWRHLTDRAVAEHVNAPVVLTVDVDPAVARAVDSGLLVSRLPRRFVDGMRAVA